MSFETECVPFLPVSGEAERTVTRQLSVGAVASVEAGVVPGVIAAHGHRQPGPPAEGQSDMSEDKHMVLYLRSHRGHTVRGSSGSRAAEFAVFLPKQENLPAVLHRGEHKV